LRQYGDGRLDFCYRRSDRLTLRLLLPQLPIESGKLSLLFSDLAYQELSIHLN